ncbi:NHS protein, partial [Thinocorus orbignyianus]|nr:NHS protein [Thinocorus orbignyianus]
MPFYKRSVVARRGRAAVPLGELRDVCSLAALTLLRQLADLCGHSLALLGDIEGQDERVVPSATLVSLCSPLPAATSNLDLESKKAAPTKLSWQQPVNVFLAAGRPPGMEQLHQEAQLNLQSLLQGRGQRWEGDLPAPQGHPRMPLAFLATSLRCLMPFPMQPPGRRGTEEEGGGTGALGTDTSLSLPTSPDKQPGWSRAFPLPTLEEKQQHPSCSVQTNIVPINVS